MSTVALPFALRMIVRPFAPQRLPDPRLDLVLVARAVPEVGHAHDLEDVPASMLVILDEADHGLAVLGEDGRHARDVAFDPLELDGIARVSCRDRERISRRQWDHDGELDRERAAK
jgi:hypothetical protein